MESYDPLCSEGMRDKGGENVSLPQPVLFISLLDWLPTKLVQSGFLFNPAEAVAEEIAAYISLKFGGENDLERSLDLTCGASFPKLSTQHATESI